MSEFADKQKGLQNVLRYTQGLLSLNERVILDIAREPYPSFLEAQIRDLPGVEVNVDGETWIRVQRLRETPPPLPDPLFSGWAAFGARPSPDSPPKLEAERMLTLDPEEISDLFEAKLLTDPADVLRPLPSDGDPQDRLDVLLRTAAMPEFRSLWQAYLDGPWAAWAARERPVRRSIDFYNRLYQTCQRVLSLGDDNPIDLVFGVGMARWRRPDARVNVPLIEQLVELDLHDDGAILVRPRSTPPLINLRPFHELEIDGAKTLQRDLAVELERGLEDPDLGFSPFEPRTFEALLRACAARLSSTGAYWPDLRQDASDRSVPEITDALTITDTWALYVRQRSEDFRREDLERLIRCIEAAEDEAGLPRPALRLVEPPSDRRPYEDGASIDLSSTDLVLPEASIGWKGGTGPGTGAADADGRTAAGAGRRTYFFPLSYNDDQIAIMERLESGDADGVLVQGPPGTGKTHTIANIICHYLATNRRVLVTAKTPEALTALQEKLPPEIRCLAIAVIHNDREGGRQLEQAVTVLAGEAKSVNVRQVEREIGEKQARLATLKQRIQEIDDELYAHAERNLARVAGGERPLLPMELARTVAEQRPLHAWFPDPLTLDARFEPRFTDADIAEAEGLRRTLGADLIYGVSNLPDPATLPDMARVLAAHGELQRLTEIDSRAERGEVPYVPVDAVGLDQAREIRVWLRDVSGLIGELVAEGWLLDAYHALAGVKRMDPAVVTALHQSFTTWAALNRQGREFALKGVRHGEAPLDDPAFNRALADLAAGRQPFGLFGFLKGGLKARIVKVEVEGRPPASAEDWGTVVRFRDWQRAAIAFLDRWSSIARLAGVPALSRTAEAGLDELMRLGRLLEGMLALLEVLPARLQLLKQLYPYGVDLDAALYQGRCAPALAALEASLERAELVDAEAVRRHLRGLAGEGSLPWHSAVRQSLEALGDPEVGQGALAQAWKQVQEEARRLDALRPLIGRLDTIVAKVADSGAPRWAERLRRDAPGDSPWSAVPWRSTWEWARADGFIRSLDDRGRIGRLTQERVEAEAEQKRVFTDVIRLRTYLGLKRGLTERVEAALAKFASAIAKLGKGTGRGADRQRRIIREATLDAAAAIPCWILPEWRVSEQLPAQLAAFDLVIIDEASQSDITALPALLRGKKVLIVGDDRQVSPTLIGVEDRKIIQLRTTFLGGLPFANQMDPATSLYELGGMLFPGRAILLREHFRCVEPIIRFSSRFYPHPLIPLRLPTASERLDPPLIDIHVPHGRKLRDVNPAEADVIVEEIRTLTADPAYARRSIGVISLIGDKQAKLIYDRLIRDLGAEIMERHRIMCGNAAKYQGQERDIIFLSMVACPRTAIAQTSRLFEQRFNVALSRARDRMVLVRSVTSSHLKPSDLKLAVLEHFRNPMGGGNIAGAGDILALCESDFERDFGRRLLALGYRIRPQVPVGGWRIDFVIEGRNDRRLAIELDGDKYHGPDRWAADVRRQKSLERLGWRFWRCWGSSWITDPDSCLGDLRRVLDDLGIDPIGAAPVDMVYTRHIDLSAPAEETGIAASEGIAPATTTVDRTPADAAAPGEVVPLPVGDDAVVEIGDLVVVRFNDEPGRPRRFRISASENRPDEGIVQWREPIAAALIGGCVDDEVEILAGGHTRTAVIERIEKNRAKIAAE